MYLRSTTVGAAFSRLLALLANITPGCIWTGTATTASMMVAGVVVCAFHIFHCLIIIAAGGSAWKSSNFVLHVHLFTLQQNVDNLSKLEIPRAEPAGVPALVLGMRLQPEQVPLGARSELQDKNAAIGSISAGWFIGGEATIGGHHHQVDIGLIR